MHWSCERALNSGYYRCFFVANRPSIGLPQKQNESEVERFRLCHNDGEKSQKLLFIQHYNDKKR